MPYTYNNINQIDKETLDYLKFVLPTPVEETPINEINRFLTELDKYYLELDTTIEVV